MTEKQVICCDIGHTVFVVDDRNVTLRCLMWCHSYFLENVSMIIIITDQTNSQHNVIAAADKLVKSGANVTILGTSYVVTSASITNDGKTGKLL